MNRSLLFLLLGTVLPAFAEQLPAEVATFVSDHQNCEHFSGEEPYDEERRAFLQQRRAAASAADSGR